MKRIIYIAAALLTAVSAWARGGGGCVEEGTLIATPAGNVRVEQLSVGDVVSSPSPSGLQRATVRAVFRVEPAEFIEITRAGHTLRLTPEHPVAVEPGEFLVAGKLADGRLVKAERAAYNLLVSPGGTFLANGIAVHNKGCFLPDTPVWRADGSAVPISEVRPGDRLLAFTAEGTVVVAPVRELIIHVVDEYLVIRTERALLKVTAEHPFYVGDGRYRTFESLRIGDQVYAYDGTGISPQPIVSAERVTGRTRVYNLRTDEPHTFFANGFAVHNKGGCFPAGTRVRTPRGPVAIERLQPSDKVWSVDEHGRLVQSVVEANFATQGTLVEVATSAGIVRVTADHPFSLSDGNFLAAGGLAQGQRVMSDGTGKLLPAAVRQVRQLTGEADVYNLRVGGSHTFIADGFVVHNKGGGCFPLGTLVRTPEGEKAIEELVPGAAVLAITPTGAAVTAQVRKVLLTQSPVCKLTTADGQVLRATAEHPLRTATGAFRSVADLVAGQAVMSWRNDRLEPAAINAIKPLSADVPVVNLEVDAPHTFIADGFVVHNKGGSFHSSGSRGGSDAPPAVFIIFFGLVIVMVVIGKAAEAKKAADENLDFVYAPAAVNAKAGKTAKLLEFLAKTDPVFDPEKLEQWATETFVKLQECWQAREYGPMQPLMMPDLYADHLGQVQGMRRNHEINVMDNLQVLQVDLVNVRYTEKENEREFTALITARMRDYYVDDRTQGFLRGDDSPATFQEFWTFQRQNGAWLLREIEQTRESDKLKEENFFEQMTEGARERIYAEAAGQEGPTGPWLGAAVETKDTRIERMLNFLIQTDKLWDRQAMLDRARQVFMRVTLTREAGDINTVPEWDLFPAVATDLRQEITRLKTAGSSVEYRNLCVRKVELVLVRNFADNTRDEFTARISAHAQKIIRRAGAVVSQQEYVTPFVEYWTFGRLDGQWKLKEVTPEMQGQHFVGQENVDEDSSRDQLQWYYRQPRAN